MRRGQHAIGGPLLAAAAWCLGTALPVQAQAQTEAGAALFATHCATCHQADGAGTVGLAPALKGPHWQRLGAKREYLPTVVLKGMAGSITVNGQVFVGSMPTFAAQLDDATLATIVNHLMELQGAQGRAPYTADELAAVRQSKGDPSQTRALRVKTLAP